MKVSHTLRQMALSSALTKSVLVAIVFLCSVHGSHSKAQSITQILEGTWEVKSFYCSNFLHSENSRCSNDPSSRIGKTYQFVFSPAGDGEILLGEYYFPFEMIIENEKLSLAIDMKYFVMTWYIVEFNDSSLRVIDFASEISFEDGSESFNGDFHYFMLVKRD